MSACRTLEIYRLFTSFLVQISGLIPIDLLFYYTLHLPLHQTKKNIFYQHHCIVVPILTGNFQNGRLTIICCLNKCHDLSIYLYIYSADKLIVLYGFFILQFAYFVVDTRHLLFGFGFNSILSRLEIGRVQNELSSQTNEKNEKINSLCVSHTHTHDQQT